MGIIQEELNRPLEEVFSYISERPVAAASLGEKCRKDEMAEEGWM